MNLNNYDKNIKKMIELNRIEDIPTDDYLSFVCFDTVKPAFINNPYRLVQGTSKAFRVLMTILNDCGATYGKYIPSLGYPDDETIFDEVSAWKLGENQEYLCEQIENYKYESSINIIFSASLTENSLNDFVLSELFDARAKNVQRKVLFEIIQYRINQLGWVYFVLPEITDFNIILLSEDKQKLLESIEYEFSKNELRTGIFEDKDDRLIWPV